MEFKDIIHPTRSKLEDVVPLITPLVVNIDPSGACNLTCGFCPCNTVDYKNEDRHKIMPMDIFKKIVNDLKELTHADIIKVVYLHGFGEPLLNTNIVEMIQYLKKSNVCEKIILTTNGILLTKELSDDLANSGLSRMRLSLNGLSAEDYLNTCNAKIDFNQLYNNIKYFYEQSRNKIELQIKATTYFVKTQHEKEILFNLFNNISDYLMIEDIDDFWSEFEGVKTPDSQKNNSFSYFKNGRDICASPLTNIFIHANGLVSPCCSDWKQAVVIGDIHTNSLKEIWNSDELKNLQITLLKQEKGYYKFCDHCKIRTLDSIDDVADIIIKKL